MIPDPFQLIFDIFLYLSSICYVLYVDMALIHTFHSCVHDTHNLILQLLGSFYIVHQVCLQKKMLLHVVQENWKFVDNHTNEKRIFFQIFNFNDCNILLKIIILFVWMCYIWFYPLGGNYRFNFSIRGFRRFSSFKKCCNDTNVCAPL